MLTAELLRETGAGFQVGSLTHATDVGEDLADSYSVNFASAPVTEMLNPGIEEHTPQVLPGVEIGPDNEIYKRLNGFLTYFRAFERNQRYEHGIQVAVYEPPFVVDSAVHYEAFFGEPPSGSARFMFNWAKRLGGEVTVKPFWGHMNVTHIFTDNPTFAIFPRDVSATTLSLDEQCQTMQVTGSSDARRAAWRMVDEAFGTDRSPNILQKSNYYRGLQHHAADGTGLGHVASTHVPMDALDAYLRSNEGTALDVLVREPRENLQALQQLMEEVKVEEDYVVVWEGNPAKPIIPTSQELAMA